MAILDKLRPEDPIQVMPMVLMRYQLNGPDGPIQVLSFPYDHADIARYVAKNLQTHEDIWGIELQIPEIHYKIEKFVNQINGDHPKIGT